MKTDQQPNSDLRYIRQMMEESSRFLSLSGLSGISAGIFGVLGAAYAYFYVLGAQGMKYAEYIRVENQSQTEGLTHPLMNVGVLTLFLAISSAWYFSWRKCKKNNQKFWTPSSRKMAWSLFSVLLIGGIFSFTVLMQGEFKLIASLLLVFYGLALLNASKYTNHDIVYLAYAEILAGLIAAALPDQGLLLWTIGFGIFHILYGFSMYLRYDRKSAN